MLPRARSLAVLAMGLVLVAAAGGTVAVGGCSDAAPSCAEGSHAENGHCVPDVACAAGTREQSDTCVPDGTVICAQGTSYDASGECRVDPATCAEGTVLVDGRCARADAPIKADAEETSEATVPLRLPAIGARGAVVHGCIRPRGDRDRDGVVDADLDAWGIEVDGPTLLDVTVDGVDGLAAGFEVTAPTSPRLATWSRFGANLTGDTSRRRVFLPAAGAYEVTVGDSRAMMIDGYAGPARGCYYATFRRLPLPAATPLAGTPLAGAVVGTLATDDVTLFRFRASAIADLLSVTLVMPQPQAAGSVLVLSGNQVRSLGNEGNLFGFPLRAETLAGDLDPGDVVTVVVDAVYNYGLAPTPFTLRTSRIGARRLPDSGAVDGVDADDAPTSYFYLDVSASEMVRLDLAFSRPSNALLVHPGGSFDDLASYTAGSLTVHSLDELDLARDARDALEAWLRLPPGRYYLAVRSPDEKRGVTTVTASVLRQAALPVAPGAALRDVALPLSGVAWLRVAPTTAFWSSFTGAARGFGAELRVAAYHLGRGAGTIDADSVADDFELPATGGGSAARILPGEHPGPGERHEYLIRVDDTGLHGEAARFDLAMTPRDFVDLGIVALAPVSRTIKSLGPAGVARRFFARVNAGTTLTVSAAPGGSAGDVALRRLGADESGDLINARGAGGAESLREVVPDGGWVAFEVRAVGDAPGPFTVNVVPAIPAPYALSSSPGGFTDICDGENALTLRSDSSGFPPGDEGLSPPIPLPFPFKLFGLDVAELTISSNGWISFLDGYDDYAGAINRRIPGVDGSDGVDGVLAPFWDDLRSEVCLTSGPDALIVQWTGTAIDARAAVQFQARLRPSGVVDFVYGPDHAASGGTATVGAESYGGDFGHQLELDTPGTVLPDTTRTLTPSPASSALP